jgi:hypothetical protein
MSKKIDNDLFIDFNTKNLNYKFSNLNYFLGLNNNEIFYKLNFNYKINLLINKKKKKIKKFNEKLFF